MRRAASRADCTAGSSKAIRTAMMAMTTSSSIRVKARLTLESMGTPCAVKKRDRKAARSRGATINRRVPGSAALPGGLARGLVLELHLVVHLVEHILGL